MLVSCFALVFGGREVVLKISILIVTSGRKKLLADVLQSIRSSNCGQSLETVVVVNGQDLATSNLLKNFPVKIVEIKETTPAAARNIGVRYTSGDYILFLDDDVVVPSGYFTNALEMIKQGVDVFGGPDRTRKDATKFERFFGLALQSPFMTAHTRFRHSVGISRVAGEAHLILCHMWFKSSIFKEENFKFDERLFRNEENALLWQLKERGKRIFYKADLFVYHKRKSDLASVIKTYFKSGFYRIKTFFFYPKSFNFLFLLPVLWLLLLVFSWKTAMGVAGVYLLGSFVVAVEKESFLPVVLLQVAVLFSYGVGSLTGFLSSLNFVRSYLPFWDWSRAPSLDREV